VRPTTEPGSDPTNTPGPPNQLSGWGLTICIKTAGSSTYSVSLAAQADSCVVVYANASSALR
jgi:hypothetical protein